MGYKIIIKRCNGNGMNENSIKNYCEQYGQVLSTKVDVDKCEVEFKTLSSAENAMRDISENNLFGETVDCDVLYESITEQSILPIFS